MSNVEEKQEATLTYGSVVKLHNLQTAAHLNGTTGTVMQQLASGRYELKLDNSDDDDPSQNKKPLSLKRENLIILRAVFGRTQNANSLTSSPDYIANGDCLLYNNNASNTQEKQLECLGGLMFGAVNKVPQEGSLIYVTLPRPSKLPPPTFTVRKTNKEARETYMKIWDGNFRLYWVVNKRVPSGYTLTGIVLLDDGAPGVAARFLGKIFGIELSAQPEMNISSMGINFTRFNEEFSAAFKDTTKTELGHRVLYHFVRAHGTSLMPLCPELVGSICDLLIQAYSKDPNTILDIRILKCDLLINHSHSSSTKTVGLAQIRVGEALEAAGELNKAALLYRHTAETYYDPAKGEIELHATLQEFSALAYKRDNQMEKADEGYIRALHFRRRAACQGGRAWDLNDPDTAGLLTNFLFMIDTLNEDLGSRTVRVRDRGKGGVYPIFVALLFTAGFQANEGGLIHQMVFQMGPAMGSFLKSAIRNNRQRALAALVAASDRPEKEHFYNEIANCAAPNAVFQIRGGPKRDLAQERLANIQRAREQNSVTPAIHMECCSFLGCESTTGPSTSMKSCPCKTKSYCSKECQVADWSQHKKVCTWNAQRKKERQEQQGTDVD